MSVTDFREIVAALRDVPGVADADVEPDADGGMGLLRLGLQAGVDEVAVATTVGRLLRERFGLGVDAERVQIVEDAQIHAPAAPEVDVEVPHQRVAGRPAISRMHLVSSGLDVTATVTLTSDGRTASGESRASASQSGVQRAVASATLRAVEELSGDIARFELDHLEISQLGSERTVLVALTMLSGRGTERLTGAATVREDVRQAVIRATLDALNRRLETLLT
ncbi:MAG: hypothetical protein QOJ79_780 [Actinomycetota bacterium]|jgi:hypothetical protein|nr:hypothetical protein [Actinomycetota bacterium]